MYCRFRMKLHNLPASALAARLLGLACLAPLASWAQSAADVPTPVAASASAPCVAPSGAPQWLPCGPDRILTEEEAKAHFVKEGQVTKVLLTGGQSLDDSDLERAPMFARQIEQWALMSLLSYPVGMRVDQWLHAEYPSLRAMQREGLEFVQQENLRLLSLSMGRLTVPVPLAGSRPGFRGSRTAADPHCGTVHIQHAWRGKACG